MKRRSKVSGAGVKSRRPNTMKLKHRGALKQETRRTASAADEQGEIARLTRELNEAGEQQAAVSEMLQVVSKLSGDLQPIFTMILKNAIHMCDATFGNI